MIAPEICELAIMLCCCITVCCVSFRHALEVPQINVFPFDPKCRHPPSFLLRFVNALGQISVLPSTLVLTILLLSCRPKIFPSVVHRITVLMVNRGHGFFAGHPFPNYPVAAIALPVNSRSVPTVYGLQIVTSVLRIPTGAGILRWKMVPWAVFPAQKTREGLIIKTLAQICLWWQSSVSHANLSHRLRGQGAICCSNSLLLPLCSRMSLGRQL